MSTSVNHIYDDLDIGFDFELREEALEKLESRLAEAPINILEALQNYVSQNADEYQKQVILSPAKTIRVVAPAGSGKTQTVLNRIIHKVQQGLSPKRILILTFDNSAANSLKGKFSDQLSNSINLNEFQITTLNAFGYSILREYIPQEYKQVIPDYRQRRLFKEVKAALEQKSPERFKTLPTNIEDRFYLEFFSLLKNQLFDPRSPDPQKIADFMLANQQASAFFLDSKDISKPQIQYVIQAILWLYMAYERTLQRENLLDFDDQKLRTYLAIKQSSDLNRTLQSKYDEIIVDEFQDINLLDFTLIKTLAEKAVLIVTGDDDQAIYGFRGCSPDFVIDLEKYLNRDVTSYELQRNYRNPINLVSYANQLIKHNNHRIPKSPIANRKDVSEIKVVGTLSSSLESKSIIGFIKKVMKANLSLKFKDFAVLYRTNAQSLPFQIEFILNGIPYYVRDKDNIINNETLEKLLGVLRLKMCLEKAQEPSSKDAVFTIQSYFRYTDNRIVNDLELLFRRIDNFRTAILSKNFFDLLPKAETSNLSSTIQEVVQAKTLLDTLDIIAKKFNGLRGMIGSLEDVLDERVPLGEIYELAANFKGKTKDFVSTIEQALEVARNTNAGKAQENGISLLTYFKAKGLQWHTVILTTCNEGIIPHRRASVEDERRLFYVAMTRASSNLFISYVKKACNNNVAPSRFLYEADLIKKPNT